MPLLIEIQRRFLVAILSLTRSVADFIESSIWLDWFWLRPVTVFQAIVLIWHPGNLWNWLAFLIVLVGETLLHLAWLNLADYRFWTEGVVLEIFMRHGASRFKQTALPRPPLDDLLYQVKKDNHQPHWALRIGGRVLQAILNPLSVTAISVYSDTPMRRLTAHQMYGGAAVVFIPGELADEIRQASRYFSGGNVQETESSTETADSERKRHRVIHRLFDLYHEVGHCAVFHEFYLRQIRLSIIYFAALVLTVPLLSSSEVTVTLLATVLIFMLYMYWGVKHQTRRVDLQEHSEIMADSYALLCLWGLLKSRPGEPTVAVEHAFRLLVARMVRSWRKSQHARAARARTLVQLAKRIANDPESFAWYMLPLLSILLRPPLLLKSAIIAVVLFVATQSTVSSFLALLSLGFLWLLVPYALFKILHDKAYGLKQQIYEHLRENGFEGHFLDIA